MKVVHKWGNRPVAAFLHVDFKSHGCAMCKQHKKAAQRGQDVERWLLGGLQIYILARTFVNVHSTTVPLKAVWSEGLQAQRE